MPEPSDRKAHDHPFKRRFDDCRRAHRVNVGGYAELAVTSNFTFLTGASHPDELAAQAAHLGLHAVAITDRNSLAGVVRAHVAAKETGIPLVVGTRLVFADVTQFDLLVYPTNRSAYGRLCHMLTTGKRRAEKGHCHLTLCDVCDNQQDWLAIVLPRGPFEADALAALDRLRTAFDDDRLSLAITRLYDAADAVQLAACRRASQRFEIPLVAVNDVHYHHPGRRLLQDVLTCVRSGCTVHDAGFRLFPNGERHLKSADEMARLFADFPDAVARTVEIADRARGFSLDQLRYEYPHEICPRGMTAMAYLRELTWQGAERHYPQGVPSDVRVRIEHEFKLIAELEYAPYFLTVHDIVRFARSRGILCQGRGAAANSAVCFCLDVTAVDPDRIDMLFERFVSRERNEPPDIDIDFEHERREEVIQYIYRKYGRLRAGLTAEVITYRGRSAVRDVGKALGLSLDLVDRLAKGISHWGSDVFDSDEHGLDALREIGVNPDDRVIRDLIALTRTIIGFPRHLSQHVGGFVITRGLLSELVPIENAAMPDRTVIEWDKDDIEAMGMLKVDVLGLGMLSCIRKAFELIARHHGRAWTLATIPAEDPQVYEMIQRADTVGVFQIESRAQMTMLPRLRPACFYDLVIEVAIVRPGPIVGNMVHPYLRRRNGEERPYYPDEKVKQVLAKTLGVPLFQEQAMSLAIVAAGFSPGEAELLRRAITAWKRGDRIAHWKERFITGMRGNGYEEAFAEQCFARLRGFSEYGFPESHAASFALLVYASCWLKHYYPAAFAAALLNSQPMGFYAPAQIVRDARDHGVTVRAIDVLQSDWETTLEPCEVDHADSRGVVRGEAEAVSGASPRAAGRAVRLGMHLVKGLREADARRVAEALRAHRDQITSITALWRISGVAASSLHTLAQADAFASFGLSRQQALWEVNKLKGRPLPLFDRLQDDVVEVPLPPTAELSEVGRDYQRFGLSLKRHPMTFLRASLEREGVITAAMLKDERQTPHKSVAAVAGIVLFRQRPSTAKGVIFMTLEDETGRSDLIFRPGIYKRFRRMVFSSMILLVRGRVERNGLVVHVLPTSVEDLAPRLMRLPQMSRDFH